MLYVDITLVAFLLLAQLAKLWLRPSFISSAHELKFNIYCFILPTQFPFIYFLQVLKLNIYINCFVSSSASFHLLCLCS